MDAASFSYLRSTWGLTQAQLAERLGMSARAVQDIEAGKSEVRRIHVMAMERLSLDIAIERGNPMLAMPVIRKAAFGLTNIMMG